MNRRPIWLTLVLCGLNCAIVTSADAKGVLVYPPGDKGHPSAGNPYTTIEAGITTLDPGPASDHARRLQP